ncbi:protein STPG4 isoform X1 [Protopterus annectens]|uniref:protein STPG4 isoform X1 n=1 Tax=Protopterus annectens TaxID=7888 RepID=UPI001CF96FF7|nr:protein STPG4 isoform X1 [Protopterus annectens]
MGDKAGGSKRSQSTDNKIQSGRHNQKSDQEKEESLFSDRDGWWRTTFKDTPIPGTYEVRDFIQDAQLNPIKMTYHFKGEGRKKSAANIPSGEFLMPGAYIINDFIKRLEKLPATYSFKNIPRPVSFTLGVRDKEVDVPPWHYNLIPGPVIKMPSKHVMFRSAVQRFPTIYFRPKEGPAPGHYELKGDVQHAIKSSFQSRVPRFLPIRNQKTPGPGTYEIARY